MPQGVELVEWIPKISPEFRSPWHLIDWAGMIERCLCEAVRGLCAVPIRHHKTETTLHGAVWLLTKNPKLRIIILTHSHERAMTLGKRARDLARTAGVGPMRGYDTIEKWQNDQGGGIQIMSAKQSRLGEDCHILIFDDPLDEFSSLEPADREAVDTTIAHYTARCMVEGHRGSVLGVMSRWHPDDPIGRRLLRKGWTYISFPAILDLGLETERAFAPDVWPLDELKATREEWAEKDPSEAGFWAQLQNDPKPPDSRIHDPARYSVIPEWPGWRTGYGLDMQYSSKKIADWAALVAFKVWGAKGFILQSERFKLELDTVYDKAQAFRLVHGAGQFYSYVSGPEVGSVRYLKRRGLVVHGMPARFNKLIRGQRTIDAWNSGKILVPEHGVWVPGFVSRVMQFRGVEGDEDDEFDAMVSVRDGMLGSPLASTVKPVGQRRV
jgi:hypothetical protein